MIRYTVTNHTIRPGAGLDIRAPLPETHEDPPWRPVTSALTAVPVQGPNGQLVPVMVLAITWQQDVPEFRPVAGEGA